MSYELRIGYYECGQLNYERCFKNGKPIGTWKSWFQNGYSKEDIPHDLNGMKNGIYRIWHENGNLFTEMMFVNDILNGINRRWYENGNLQFEGDYENGKQKGLTKIWDEEGKIISELFYLGNEK
jgi:hypothetical protein